MTPLYYAEGGYVWRRSAKRVHPDGTTYFASSFRVCKMADDVGPAAAEAIADMLNFARASMKVRADIAQTAPTRSSNQPYH